MSVKVYAMNKATPEIKENYNPDFIEPAIKKSDYDLLEARCKKLEKDNEYLERHFKNISLIAADRLNKNIELQSENNLLKKKLDEASFNYNEVLCKWGDSEKEISIMKKKLEKCKEQRDYAYDNEHFGKPENYIAILNKELDEIKE